MGEAIPAEVATAMGAETPLFEPLPWRVYKGHSADVVDVAWARAHFLLSASMDRTARLWHVDRTDELACFRHPDFVTAVDFHPREDRYFVSGCFDKKLRIWNIPHERVVEWTHTPHMVTAAVFSPTGEFAIAGLYQGQCIFCTFVRARAVPV